MISLRTRFDLHRDLNQWSLKQYALGLGYDESNIDQFLKYMDGKRELTPAEATMILDKHQYRYRGGELQEEIIMELEKLAESAKAATEVKAPPAPQRVVSNIRR